MWKANDAALVPLDSTRNLLLRVIGIDEDGFPFAKIGGSYFHESGDNDGWRRVGEFRRSWFGWKYIPIEPKDGAIPMVESWTENTTGNHTTRFEDSLVR